MADALQLRLDVRGLDDVAVVEVAEVELDARIVEPFQRQLVDALAGPAAGRQPFVLAGEVVVGRVDVGAVVGADLDALDGGVLAFRQRVHGDAHILRHARRGLMVVEILDLGQAVRRVGLDAGLERDGQVDIAAGHGRLLLASPVSVAQSETAICGGVYAAEAESGARGSPNR